MNSHLFLFTNLFLLCLEWVEKLYFLFENNAGRVTEETMSEMTSKNSVLSKNVAFQVMNTKLLL